MYPFRDLQWHLKLTIVLLVPIAYRHVSLSGQIKHEINGIAKSKFPLPIGMYSRIILKKCLGKGLFDSLS